MGAPDSDCKVYVGGLSFDTTNDGLKAYFAQFGEVTDAICMVDKMTGRPRGFGFVTFAEPAAANAVIGTACTIDGREVSCKKAVRENRADPGPGGGDGQYNTVKVFVGGLPATCDHDKFVGFFGQYGAIQDAVVMMDQQTQRHRGFGYVTFSDPAAVEACLQTYSTNTIDGKWIEVKRCIPQDKMGPGKGKGGGKGFGKGKGQDYGGGYGGGYGQQPAYGGYAQQAGGGAYGGAAYGAAPAYGGYGGAYAQAGYGQAGAYGGGVPGYGGCAGYGAAGGLAQQTFAPQGGMQQGYRSAPY